MMPENNSDSISRGRTQTAKPLTDIGATSSLTAPTASTLAKSKPQGSAATADKRPANSIKASAPSTAANAAQKTALPQKGREGKIGAPDASEKPKSQPLKAVSKQEPLEMPVTEEATPGLQETSTGDLEEHEDKAMHTPVTAEALQDSLAEATEAEPAAKPNTTQTPVIPSTAEPLQIAAQTYPWIYMSSTLDACFAGSQKTAKKELDELEKQVTEDEAELAEEKAQYESERLIEFCNELGSDLFAIDAPAIMQTFTSFSEVSERVEAEALQLALSLPSLESEEPLQAFGAMMDKLGRLLEQASTLENSIQRLTEQSTTMTKSLPSFKPETHPEEASATGEDQNAVKKIQLTDDTSWGRDQIIGVFTACLPVLRARVANLSTAQELIDSAQENFSLALRMESMGIE